MDAVIGAVALVSAAHAFEIGSAATSSCHERLSLAAFDLENPLPPGVVAPEAADDARTLEVARYIEDELGLDLPDDENRALLLALYAGARYPDAMGYASADLLSLRALHMSEDGQEHHSLRAPDQDGEEGDRAAVDAARAHVTELTVQAWDSWNGAQDTKIDFWIEYYGTIQIEVWTPGFLLGVALHAIQDSFAHSYRSADARQIYAVTNFVDGLLPGWEEARDGPRHSTMLDRCDAPEVESLADAAEDASVAYLRAVRESFSSRDSEAVEGTIDQILAYAEGCGYAADYCGTPWADIARMEETTAPCGCEDENALVVLGPGLLGAWARRRRRSGTG